MEEKTKHKGILDTLEEEYELKLQELSSLHDD